MNNISNYCMVCESEKLSTEEIAAEIQVTGIAIQDFELCFSCRAQVEKHLSFIRTYLVKDENDAPSLSQRDKRSLRMGLTQRMKVRELKSAERRKLYFK